MHAFLTNLYAVFGNKAYLIKMRAARVLSVAGVPTVDRGDWVGDSFNLRGFRVNPEKPPTFAEYTEVHHREPDLGFDLAITGIRVNWSLVEKGTDWRFDDSGWDSRTARLGYDESASPTPPATELHCGGDADDKHRTTYFRRSFHLTDAGIYDEVRLQVWRNDGVAIYLNGNELFRNNLSISYLDQDSYAESGVGGDGYVEILVPATQLLTGENDLAAEVAKSERFDARTRGGSASMNKQRNLNRIPMAWLLMLTISTGAAGAIQAPGHILYGLLDEPGDSVTLETGGAIIAAFAWGADPEADARGMYVLRVPMDAVGARSPDRMRPGNTAALHVNGTPDPTALLTIGAPGSVTLLHLETHLDADGARDTYDDGISDHAEVGLGLDPNHPENAALDLDGDGADELLVVLGTTPNGEQAWCLCVSSLRLWWRRLMAMNRRSASSWRTLSGALANLLPFLPTGQQDSGADEPDTCQVVHRQQLAQQQHGEQGSEHRHQVQELTGAVRPEIRDAPVPENVGQNRGK